MPYTVRQQNVAPAYSLSDVILMSNDTQDSVLADSYTKYKEMKIIQDVFPKSSLRIKHDSYDIGANTITSRLYRNGVAVGSVFVSHSDGTWVTNTDDIGFTDLHYGDVLQIYAYRTLGGGILGALRNFRVYGTPNPFTDTLE
jgi:uncharacterized protein (DUF1501 family)